MARICRAEIALFAVQQEFPERNCGKQIAILQFWPKYCFCIEVNVNCHESILQNYVVWLLKCGSKGGMYDKVFR